MGTPDGETSLKKIFFSFLHDTDHRKNLPLTFSSEFRLKVLKNPAKRAKVSFFYKLRFFRRDHTNTHT